MSDAVERVAHAVCVLINEGEDCRHCRFSERGANNGIRGCLYDAAQIARAALAAAPGREWMPIETAPKDDDRPFLVLTPGNDVASVIVLQVTRFEGRLYPDGLNGAIDWDDGVTNASHWQPLPAPPNREG